MIRCGKTPGQFTLKSQPPLHSNTSSFPRESPWSHEVRTTVASRFEVLNGNAENEEMLRIATSSHYIGFESLVNDIVEFSSLRGNGGLRMSLVRFVYVAAV